jgi:hypothetical protein
VNSELLAQYSKDIRKGKCANIDIGLGCVPLGDCVTLNGHDYRYDIIERDAGEINLKIDDGEYAQINIRDADPDFREWCAEHTRERRSDAYVEALGIHKHRDPREYILNTFNTLHVSDRDVGGGILIGCTNQSILNSHGVQPNLTGETGEGKTHAAQAMIHLFPPNYVLNETLSDKALYYLRDDLKKAGLVIFSDDFTLSEVLEGTIKRAMSNFQGRTAQRISVKVGGQWVSKKVEIPERIMWLLTSVDDKGSEQFVNRQIGFGVDASEDQDRRIVAFEKEKAAAATEEWPLTDEVLVCRELIRMIKEDEVGNERTFKVKIPFSGHIEWSDTKNRRNFPLFLDLVKGYAVLRFMQREIDEEGCIIATEKDFDAAVRLYGSRAGLQKLHVTEAEKRFLQVLDQEGGEADTAAMMAALKISSNRVYQLAQRLCVKLQGFDIEKRSVLTDDDAGKQSTQKNIYRLHGSLTLADYESVVWLKDDDPSDHDVPQEALEPRSNPTQSPDVLPAQSAQNKDINQNKDYNHKINNRSTALEDLSGRYNDEHSPEDTSTHRRLCSAGGSSSGRETAEHNAEIGIDSSKQDADGSEGESCGWGSEGFDCSSGASSTDINANPKYSSVEHGLDHANGLQIENSSELDFGPDPLVRQAEFECYVREKVGCLAERDREKALAPELLCNVIVNEFCQEHNISDRQSRIKLARHFSKLVNEKGAVAPIFLRLTGGKLLLLAGDELARE